MKKSRICVALLFSGIITLILFTTNCYGNPVPVGGLYNFESSVFTIGLLLSLLIFTIIIELGVLYFAFRRYIVESRCFLVFLKCVLVVNLFTYPMTQLIGFLLSAILIQIIPVLIISEIVPISIEYLLYLRLFDALYASNDLIIPIPRRRLSVSTIIANLLTFSLGIIVYLPTILSFAFS